MSSRKDLSEVSLGLAELGFDPCGKKLVRVKSTTCSSGSFSGSDPILAAIHVMKLPVAMCVMLCTVFPSIFGIWIGEQSIIGREFSRPLCPSEFLPIVNSCPRMRFYWYSVRKQDSTFKYLRQNCLRK